MDQVNPQLVNGLNTGLLSSVQFALNELVGIDQIVSSNLVTVYIK